MTARWRSCSGLTTTAKSTGRSRSRRMGVALLVVDPAEPPSALGTVSAQSFGAVVVGGAAVDSGAIVQGAVHAPDTLPHRHQDSDIVRPALTSCRSVRPRKLRKRACNARTRACNAGTRACNARMQRAHAPHGMGMYDWVAAARLSAVATQRCIGPFRRAGVMRRDVFVFDYTRHPSKPNPDGAPRRDH